MFGVLEWFSFFFVYQKKANTVMSTPSLGEKKERSKKETHNKQDKKEYKWTKIIQ